MRSGTQERSDQTLLGLVSSQVSARVKMFSPETITHHLLHRLTQIETVILSDYRLVGNFIEGCYDDIQREGCGRLQGSSEAHSSQGKVLECLMNHLPNLTKTCENQLLKVAEYQGEDYHLDRRLFLACKKDRQHLCGKVKAGQGRVYDCLISNKDVSFLTDIYIAIIIQIHFQPSESGNVKEMSNSSDQKAKDDCRGFQN